MSASNKNSEKDAVTDGKNGGKGKSAGNDDGEKSTKSRKSVKVQLPSTDNASGDDGPGPKGSGAVDPLQLKIPESNFRSLAKPSQPSQPTPDQPALANRVSKIISPNSGKDTPKPKPDQQEVSEMTLIRRKREERSLNNVTNSLSHSPTYRSNLRKDNLERQQKLQILAENFKENARLRRHSMQQRQVLAFKKAQVEKRASIEKAVKDLIEQNEARKKAEASKYIKERKAAYLEEFKKEHELFVKRQKEKERKKQIQEKGLMKIGKANTNTAEMQTKWNEVKAERKKDNKIMNLFHSDATSQILETYQDELKQVYEFYSEIDLDGGIARGRGGGALPFQNLFLFANQLGLLNAVLEYSELKLIYYSVVNGMTWGNNLPVGLTFRQFQEVLFRIVLKFQNYFAKVQPPGDKKKPLPMETVPEILHPEFRTFDDVKDQVDEYKELDTYHYSHLDGLFYFLDLSSDRDELKQRLVEIRKAYHKAKPAEEKYLPKKELYERWRKINQTHKLRIETSFGPTDYTKRKKEIEGVRALIYENNKQRTLKTKMSLKNYSNIMSANLSPKTNKSPTPMPTSPAPSDLPLLSKVKSAKSTRQI